MLLLGNTPTQNTQKEKQMAYTEMRTAYVTDTGNYAGGERVIIFDATALTEDHWEILSSLSDGERIHFVDAVLNGRDTSEWEG
jgi:hypothetical protein